ncbi:hypothetical protein EST92_11610 [Streptomyces sp. TM32]|uniref:hypothetical protein n=1 Tax=Streptomyces sp. TM32 TaxID=1652669 RepID=UPI0010123A61|nr:hypothetical protein [Streptomyces sp. TM32]RXS84198.1 hypothetical protein EST92_11610 [Streptomyces sp. TM32]
MPIGRINAAKFIARELPAPFEELLGGENSHQVFNTAHAHWCTPLGYSIPWRDCYDGADMLPIPQKARLFLDPAGQPLPPPSHLRGRELAEVEQAIRHAVWAEREARRLSVDH